MYDNPDHPYNRLVIAPMLYCGTAIVLVAIGAERDLLRVCAAGARGLSGVTFAPETCG